MFGNGGQSELVAHRGMHKELMSQVKQVPVNYRVGPEETAIHCGEEE